MMQGTLNANIKKDIKKKFETNCIEHLATIYEELMQREVNLVDKDEETISQCIRTQADDIVNRGNLILVSTEERITEKDYLDDIKPAKRLPRVDFRFTNFSFVAKEPMCVYMEAKILVEHRVKRAQGTLSPSRLNKRYIEAGIDKIKNHTYPDNTLMIGYIVEGNVDAVLAGVNSKLAGLQRQTEQLTRDTEQTVSKEGVSVYVSMHGQLLIRHIMLKLA